MYENRIMKAVDIVLRREEEGCGRMMKGVNVIKVHGKHVSKCHNEFPHTTNICKQIKIILKKKK
jgi:hypothetical protein